MIIVGLLLLAAVVVVALAGVLGNLGGSHRLASHSFDIFGYHASGSTGRLLLAGIILGAIAMFAFNLLLVGLGRGFKRRVSTRRRLKADRRENARLTTEQDRLSRQLAEERTAHSHTSATAAVDQTAGATRASFSEKSLLPKERP